MSQTIANHLLDIQAVTLSPNEPFTWSSGLKSPIYCDNRLTMSYPHVRKDIAKGLAHLIKTYAPDADVVAGTATAGIPHAAWVAEELQLPMIYVRGSAKGHGKKNKIEGHLPASSKVVIIEDLISTGGSSIAAADAVREAGGEVSFVAAIFSYQLNAAELAFKQANLDYHVLCAYDALIEQAKERQLISANEQQKLTLWRENPHNEDWLTVRSS
ncbi:orotate phosphoribosyltransferase [Shouchella sp. 1P09AA]|uniref:orotate phosphoribosyltransferase n=1 Tax=unclassified Shouchella TaxID=2893065 RepID=UPI0039A29BBD